MGSASSRNLKFIIHSRRYCSPYNWKIVLYYSFLHVNTIKLIRIIVVTTIDQVEFLKKVKKHLLTYEINLYFYNNNLFISIFLFPSVKISVPTKLGYFSFFVSNCFLNNVSIFTRKYILRIEIVQVWCILLSKNFLAKSVLKCTL